MVGSDGQPRVDGPVGDLAVADLDVDAVDEQHRIDRVQRPVLPLGHAVEHPVGDVADGLPRHLGAVDLGQVGLHFAGRQALGDQRDHQVIHPGESALPFGHDLRLERAVPVAGHLDLHRADIGEHGLGPVPVAGVPAVAADRVVLGIAQVGVHLTVQGRFQHALGHPAQQPARTGQPQPFRTGLLSELAGQLVFGRTHLAIIRHRRRRDGLLRLTGPVAIYSCSHGVSLLGWLIRPSCPRVTPLYLQSRPGGGPRLGSAPLRCDFRELGLRGLLLPF